MMTCPSYQFVYKYGIFSIFTIQSIYMSTCTEYLFDFHLIRQGVQ